MSIINYKNTKGFTLVELLVATTIFTIVAVGGLSILLTSQKVYSRISSNRVAIDNVNMAIDTITREVKFGSRYGCVNSAVDGGFNRVNNTFYASFDLSKLVSDSDCNAIAFTPQDDKSKKIVYYFNIASSSINQATYNVLNYGTPLENYILEKDMLITAQDFKISDFLMNVAGVESVAQEDYFQPRVDFSISGVITSSRNSQGYISTSTLTIYTSISQRSLDN